MRAISYRLSAIGYWLAVRGEGMMTDWFTIREEAPGDLEAVCAVNRAAFGGEGEAALVRLLWADGEVMFGLVAEVDGQVVGHVLFSRLPIETVTGETISAAALAPLAVLPTWQGRGIGSALVRQGLGVCGRQGVPAVVVLGDPDYYSRFGFSAELARELETPWSGPHLMAIELAPGGLGDGKGVASYPQAFRQLEST
jgi:putative acetyltransferase